MWAVEDEGDVVDTVSMFCLDACHSLDRLLICSTDGSVRVWSDCTDRDGCSMRSAWQAVPICMPPAFVLAPACYDWQPTTGRLFSAGLSLPGVVQLMDLEYEQLVQQVSSSQPTSFKSKCQHY